MMFCEDGLKEKKIKPWRNLWPAALTGLLIACASSVMKPTLASVPELLEYTAPEESKTPEKPELKDTAAMSKLAKKEKKKTKKSTSEAFEDRDSYIDGIYIGSAQGFGGEITVQVRVTAGKISDVTIVSSSGETEPYFSQAKNVLSQIIRTGSPNVDTVSGATCSSNGILNAVKRALMGAGGSASDQGLVEMPPAVMDTTPVVLTPVTVDPSVITSKPVNALNDGIYTGTGEGFGGDIELEITVKNGKIVQLAILSAENETPKFFNKAKAILTEILNQQSAEVDAVSGATFSSEGILEALEDAIKKAERKEESEEAPDSDEEEGRDESEEAPDSDEEEGRDEEKEPEDDSGEEEDSGSYYDGIFSARALCTDARENQEDYTFLYTVNVSLFIDGGKITDVSVLKEEDYSENSDDNEPFFSFALNGRTRKGVFYPGLVSQILEHQSADELDIVSSATYTSEALIQAAREALTSARGQEVQF